MDYLPEFVLAALGILAAGGVAWAGWVSSKLVDIAVSTKGIEVTVEDHSERLDVLETLHPRIQG